MFRRISILVAVLGLGAAIYVVATAREDIPSPPPAQPPSANPYARGIVALGLVEPSTEVVDVAAPEPGRVMRVLVSVTDVVRAGDPLFELDNTLLQAELIRAEASLSAAGAEITRLESWPRAEDVPPVEAEVAEASERMADAQQRLETITSAAEKGGASEDEVTRQRYLVSALRASLANAQSRLDLLTAGAWDQDLAVARATRAERAADIRAIRLRLERLIVRAPLDATVLKRNIEPGEYASSPASASASDAPIILGDLSEIHIRAQVDEEDMPLLRAGAAAIARIRGPFKIEVPLDMLRVEPIAGPKRQISGSSTELIDTRVVDVLFHARPAPGGPPLYPGQVVDVYIDAGETAR